MKEQLPIKGDNKQPDELALLLWKMQGLQRNRILCKSHKVGMLGCYFAMYVIVNVLEQTYRA